jgi:hypothetical protein
MYVMFIPHLRSSVNSFLMVAETNINLMLFSSMYFMSKYRFPPIIYVISGLLYPRVNLVVYYYSVLDIL